MIEALVYVMKLNNFLYNQKLVNGFSKERCQHQNAVMISLLEDPQNNNYLLYKPEVFDQDEHLNITSWAKNKTKKATKQDTFYKRIR